MSHYLYKIGDRVIVNYYGYGEDTGFILRDNMLATVVGYRMDNHFYVVKFDYEEEYSTFNKQYLKRAETENDILRAMCSK